MLEKLILDHFQRHRKLSVALDPVTVFTGPSQRGKSSVLRALLWVGRNEPFGARYATWGHEAVSAALKVDGRWVVRKWSPKENAYEMDGQPFLSLRAPSVPETVEAALNLDPLNYQLQFDSPFWLFETAGEVSRRLNEVVNLGEIDAAMAEAAAHVKTAKAAVENCTTRLADAEKKRTDLAWVLDADTRLAEVEAKHAELETVQSEVADLEELLGELLALDERIKELDPVIEKGERLLDLLAELTTTRSDVAVLSDILGDLDRSEWVLRSTEGVAERFDSVARVRDRGTRVADDRAKLESLLNDLEKAEAAVCQADDVLEGAVAELNRRMDGRCPLCGQPATVSQVLSATPTSA